MYYFWWWFWKHLQFGIRIVWFKETKAKTYCSLCARKECKFSKYPNNESLPWSYNEENLKVVESIYYDNQPLPPNITERDIFSLHHSCFSNVTSNNKAESKSGNCAAHFIPDFTKYGERRKGKRFDKISSNWRFSQKWHYFCAYKC